MPSHETTPTARPLFRPLATLALALPLAQACKSTDGASDVTDNTLLAEWSGPYGGVPAFDEAKLEDLAPALRAGMERSLAEIEAIASNPEPPTFENTIVAMLDSAPRPRPRSIGSGPTRGSGARTWRRPEVPRALQARNGPGDQGRVRVEDHRRTGRCSTADQGRFTKVTRGQDPAEPGRAALGHLARSTSSFARSGATLEGEAAGALRRHRASASRSCYTSVRATTCSPMKRATSSTSTARAARAGCSDCVQGQAAAAAAEGARAPRGRVGDHQHALVDGPVPHVLRGAAKLRERVWRNYYSRGDNGDAHDNSGIIAEILALRARAREDCSATRKLRSPGGSKNRMAQTPENGRSALMEAGLAGSGRARRRRRSRRCRPIADAEAKRSGAASITIEPWDYRYYADKVRKAKYDARLR